MFERNDGERRYHGSELADGQVALRCYTSPFDALLDVSRNPVGVVGRDQSIVTHPVDALRPERDGTSRDRQVVACVHVAWRARLGKLVIRPDGMPDAVLSTSPELGAGDTVRDLPAKMVRLVDEIHEQAGLFAWRETANTFSDWSARDLQALTHQAWRDAPTIEAEDGESGFDQFALYDPEFWQWRFVQSDEVIALVWRLLRRLGPRAHVIIWAKVVGVVIGIRQLRFSPLQAFHRNVSSSCRIGGNSRS